MLNHLSELKSRVGSSERARVSVGVPYSRDQTPRLLLLVGMEFDHYTQANPPHGTGLRLQ